MGDLLVPVDDMIEETRLGAALALFWGDYETLSYKTLMLEVLKEHQERGLNYWVT